MWQLCEISCNTKKVLHNCISIIHFFLSQIFHFLFFKFFNNFLLNSWDWKLTFNLNHSIGIACNTNCIGSQSTYTLHPYWWVWHYFFVCFYFQWRMWKISKDPCKELIQNQTKWLLAPFTSYLIGINPFLFSFFQSVVMQLL